MKKVFKGLRLGFDGRKGQRATSRTPVRFRAGPLLGILGLGVLLAACPGGELEPLPSPEPQHEFVMVYAYPQDKESRFEAMQDSIAGSVEIFQDWLEEKAGVRIKFSEEPLREFRVPRDEQWLAEREPVEEIEKYLLGDLADGQIIALWYDGTNIGPCGGAAWPPRVAGRIASSYIACDSEPFWGRSSSGPSFGYREAGMLHDILHALGYVPASAPDSDNGGGQTADRRDLMYHGPQGWTPRHVDPENKWYRNLLLSSEYVEKTN